MSLSHNRSDALLAVITTVPALLLVSVLLFWGVHSLLYPFVPGELLAENALVSAVLVLTAVLLAYAFFRPRSGGYLLCIWAVPLGLIFYAFRRSIWSALYPSWDWGVGYHPVFAAIAGLFLLLGVLFVVRGRPSRPTALEAPAQLGQDHDME